MRKAGVLAASMALVLAGSGCGMRVGTAADPPADDGGEDSVLPETIPQMTVEAGQGDTELGCADGTVISEVTEQYAADATYMLGGTIEASYDSVPLDAVVDATEVAVRLEVEELRPTALNTASGLPEFPCPASEPPAIFPVTVVRAEVIAVEGARVSSLAAAEIGVGESIEFWIPGGAMSFRTPADAAVKALLVRADALAELEGEDGDGLVETEIALSTQLSFGVGDTLFAFLSREPMQTVGIGTREVEPWSVAVAPAGLALVSDEVIEGAFPALEAQPDVPVVYEDLQQSAELLSQAETGAVDSDTALHGG